ncbi:MAG: M20/M25/M40 family metallo-hydrolase [Gemmatimonadaceae bacterium]|nr:M20/M25/M40 family metallo-hydrolase [Gemmatimonadaceae bacterium]
MPLFVRRLTIAAAFTPALLLAQRPGGGAPTAPNAMALPIPSDQMAQLTACAGLPVTDPVLLRASGEEGMMPSVRPVPLARCQADSIGPRLTGSPGFTAAGDWLMKKYAEWGITARKEQWGTWNSFQRGVTHVDLVAPRTRTLEATMLAWSPATNGAVTGDVVVLPEFASADAAHAWLMATRGKFVMVNAPNITCRTPQQMAEFGMPSTLTSMRAAQDSIRISFNNRNVASAGLQDSLKAYGAAGVVTFGWSNDLPASTEVFRIAAGSRLPNVRPARSSEPNYGWYYGLATKNQGPKLRVQIESQFLGEQPVHNTIAEVKGTGPKAKEYVMLSAHYDSWEASSGATDNATGTITMLEAMRILKSVGYKPRRTILAGHWAGEERASNGSRSFVKDHPEVVANLHALFNQDNGTGRIVNMNASGLVSADTVLRGYLSQLPNEFTQWIRYTGVGAPGSGGTDHVSFVCAGAPGFNLGALSWDYGFTTWHTNRDTYDKIIVDDLKQNATLTAMLIYLASEDPTMMRRIKRDPLPAGPSGSAGAWPTCVDGTRNTSGYRR